MRFLNFLMHTITKAPTLNFHAVYIHSKAFLITYPQLFLHILPCTICKSVCFPLLVWMSLEGRNYMNEFCV